MTLGMFVVLEWNQASHQPSIACTDVHYNAAEARDCKEELASQVKDGRGEWFTVHELDDVFDEEEVL
jgi:hypothetical protein